MPSTAYNPRAPELTPHEARDVVDAFLGQVLRSVEQTRHLRSELREQLDGLSAAATRRILGEFDRRRTHLLDRARKINL